MSEGEQRAYPSPLLLAYVDESYTVDYFYLGAIVVDGAAARRIEDGLNQITVSYTHLTLPTNREV